MAYDVDAVRDDFPALNSGWAFFDGPGGTQTPTPVVQAMTAALSSPLSNRGSHTHGELNAERIVVEARSAIANLTGSDAGGVVFARSATQLAYDFSRMLAPSWTAGDEIIVTRLDHDSNVRPWVQAAERAGATLVWADFNPATSELADVSTLVTGKTRLVAVTAASNLIGTIPPVAEISRAAHAVGALVYVDGVHYAAHSTVDVDALGADFFTCSPYKFLGPHLGALVASPALLETLMPDKLLPSSDAVPERFELGTLPYELLAGVTAAVDYLSGLGGPVKGSRRDRLEASFTQLERHEDALRTLLENGIAQLPGVQTHSRAARRTPTMLVSFTNRNAADAHAFLAHRQVAAPASHFYAIEASRRLGLGDFGGLRIGLAPYTSTGDVERLLEGLAAFIRS
jgi:cysteine desulfurase family protein (TIGR01976 family)